MTLSTIQRVKSTGFLAGVDLLDFETMRWVAFVAATHSKLILNISGGDMASTLLAKAQEVAKILGKFDRTIFV